MKYLKFALLQRIYFQSYNNFVLHSTEEVWPLS